MLYSLHELRGYWNVVFLINKSNLVRHAHIEQIPFVNYTNRNMLEKLGLERLVKNSTAYSEIDLLLSLQVVE